jgi:hypothetical protein
MSSSSDWSPTSKVAAPSTRKGFRISSGVGRPSKTGYGRALWLDASPIPNPPLPAIGFLGLPPGEAQLFAHSWDIGRWTWCWGAGGDRCMEGSRPEKSGVVQSPIVSSIPVTRHFVVSIKEKQAPRCFTAARPEGRFGPPFATLHVLRPLRPGPTFHALSSRRTARDRWGWCGAVDRLRPGPA